MNIKKIGVLLLAAVLLGAMVQAGASIFADEHVSVPHDIPQEVLDRIREGDPDRYEERVDDFRSLLAKLDVHPSFQSEIERLVLADYPIQDVLIAYEFLYDRFGVVRDLSRLAAEKRDGAAWNDIFAAYDAEHPAFEPRAFESDYLERLLSTPEVTADDVMIADRVSFHSGRTVESLFETKMQQSLTWKDLNAQLGILNSASELPRVQVTAESIEKYTGTSGLTEDQATAALVIAHKTETSAETVVEWTAAGLAETDILAQIYEERYN
jgi:hypothetical protein